jgi:hypothetical protein
MKADRFSITVERSNDHALVVMDCGKGVLRGRTMPIELLETMGAICTDMRTLFAKVLREGLEVPLFPRFLEVAEAKINGAFRVLLGAHRLDDGTVEPLVAFYDEGDDTAPALLLIDGQIEEFIDQAKAAGKKS